MVQAKGTTVPVKVFELLGTTPGCDESIDAPQVLVDSIEEWENAYAAYVGQWFGESAEMFGALAKSIPGDLLAVRMMEKSYQYQSDPPGENWDGVDIFKTK
jgi:hypothetical protein